MKHAVLVMAHGDLSILQKCLILLDDERFDFFIHVDAKSSDDGHWLAAICKKSHVFFTKRIAVFWGHHSQTKAAVILVRHAVESPEKYAYYHLISAVDMPLKTPSEIDSFFQNNMGLEFITTRGKEGSNDWRMKYNYPFLRKYNRTPYKFINDVQKALYSRILRFPRKAGTSILRDKGWSVYMGDLWWSITDRVACKLVDMEEELMPFWENCYVSDETFVQTLVMNLPELAKYQTNLKTRQIDWSRGRPYTWAVKDYEELMQSSALFARKFDPAKPQVVEMIFDTVMKRNVIQTGE